MLTSEIEAQTLSKEVQRLRRALFVRTSQLAAALTALIVFILIAAHLAAQVAVK